ncbi:MAG: hypothetical protein U9Q12_02495 [Patescibacteria group bacterium]|nr:hypothetical protein [Patescibacteria group bacterium]
MNQEIRTNITSLVFAVVCVVLYFFFPINAYKFEIFVGTLIFLLLLPILYTKLILHKTYTDIGFTSMTLQVRDVLFIFMSIILGGLFSFIIVSVGWGVEEYAQILSKTIFTHFGAFAIYELFFSSIMLFLFTFFSWGFVYSFKCENKIYTYIISLIIFTVFLINFYANIWIVLPLLIPAFFVPQIRDKKNIIYIFIAIFIINLILDTLIIKSFS